MTLNLRDFQFAPDTTFIVVLLLFVGCVFLSSVIPPLKSPDEHDHIERAYLLGKGVIVLDQLKNAPSGGYVDSGLLQYTRSYRPDQKKLSVDGVTSSREIRWSHHRVYDPSPGTGYYFPLIYLPQTTGLLIGERLNLTVDKSYKLARGLSMSATLFLLLVSFKIYAPNPLVLALIVMPMTLFQMSSASLDGITTALAVFAISAFLRIAADKSSSPNGLLYALAVAVSLLATSRLHALPMLLLLLAGYAYSKNGKVLLCMFASATFIFWWNLFAMKTTVDLRMPLGDTTTNIVLFYIQAPSKFFTVLWATLSDSTVQIFYHKSFVGILGWLDAAFHDRYYQFFTAMICVIALLSVSIQRIECEWPQRLLLLFVSAISAIFVFCALLVTWSPHPARAISGIQGRYFLIPAIIFAYGLAGGADLIEGVRRKLAVLLLLCLFLVSVYATSSLMIVRYYLTARDLVLHFTSVGLEVNRA
jgi:uncharacterized membrane protein